jgi:hypothetical protein
VTRGGETRFAAALGLFVTGGLIVWLAPVTIPERPSGTTEA